MPGEEVWLIGEHRSNGERKYYLSNLPSGTPLKVLAGTIKARWICEQAHQQLKEELGLDHFEGRSWTGLHRHALMTMIASAFLQSRRLQQAGGGKRITGPPPQPNAAQIALELHKLGVVGSVLYVAAHPDDENTALLAYLANGAQVRTAYLSLTRGDGGQNLIGSEQGPALGLIRTQELLAARRIDGAELASGVAVTVVGASGTPEGVTGEEADEAGPVPLALVAVTVNV